jgi:hypothetical protein
MKNVFELQIPRHTPRVNAFNQAGHAVSPAASNGGFLFLYFPENAMGCKSNCILFSARNCFFLFSPG